MYSNTCLRSLLFSKPQHTVGTQLSISRQLLYRVFVWHMHHQVRKRTFQSDPRYDWQGKRAMLASVRQSDCRYGLVLTFLLPSAETPAGASASVAWGLNFDVAEWTAHLKWFRWTGPFIMYKSAVIVAHSSSDKVAVGWGFAFLLWDFCLNEEWKYNWKQIVTGCLYRSHN